LSGKHDTASHATMSGGLTNVQDTQKTQSSGATHNPHLNSMSRQTSQVIQQTAARRCQVMAAACWCWPPQQLRGLDLSRRSLADHTWSDISKALLGLQP